ncbi:hypothetical protein AB0K52_14350 [Glycomyces sp. NPDC049804]|uniref:hypothetical protein n=1 Tax=Glycomyces sp. NPDC049804 TaxID=3154363 RepID=UPI003441E7B2
MSTADSRIADLDAFAAAGRRYTTWEYCRVLGSLLAARRSHAELQSDLQSRIDRAAMTLAARQDQGGHFPSAEFGFAATEVTAQALITLAQAGYPRDRTVDRALDFLERQVRLSDGSVRSTSDGEDVGWPRGPEPTRSIVETLATGEGVKRVLPASLTLLAFSLWDTRPEQRELIAEFLLRQGRQGMWGPIQQAPPSPAFTAVALTALISSRHDSARFDDSFRYLRSTRLRNGRWVRDLDQWLVSSQDHELYASISIPTTTWCLTALDLIEDPRSVRGSLAVPDPLRANDEASPPAPGGLRALRRIMGTKRFLNGLFFAFIAMATVLAVVLLENPGATAISSMLFASSVGLLACTWQLLQQLRHDRREPGRQHQ